jgi:2-oxoglutarate dehydrogenase E2 component (dihydrolipoamide succinyltransferase)
MISIKVPPLGESIVEATVSRWAKKSGEQVAAGDTLVELETDKITVEVPAPSAGVLSKTLVSEGDVVKVDQALAELDESATGASAPAAAAESGQKAPAKETAEPAKEAPASAAGGSVRASPGAQRAAAERGVDISSVSGTGRGGVVSKPDVIEQAASLGAPPAGKGTSGSPPGHDRSAAAGTKPAQSDNGNRETREKMSTRRKRIAENLLHAQHATAHLTTFNEIDMTAVDAVRSRHKDRIEKERGVKLSYMPFFVKAACQALEAYPIVNAQVDGDSVVYKHYVNMGIAVASEAGLVVPNIKDAHTMSLVQLGKAITDLAKHARDGKLTMDDLTGGTFTITNGGVFGSLVSTPIINFPQSAILGLHKIQDRPVAIDGKVEIRPMMYIALSYDHRIIDGQQAVLFLVRVKELMEDPAAMLIG